MSYQWVIDNAASLSVTTQPTVAQSFTRSNRPRAVNRGGDSYRWTVQMPAGMPYTEARPYIAAYEELSRDTVILLSIPQTYISGYQGTADSTTNWVATFALASDTATINSTGGASFPTPNSKLFGAGDFVQPVIGGGQTARVYTLTADSFLNSGAPADLLQLHRPANETGQYPINIGENCVFRMLATKVPRWEIFDYDLVRWTGEFEFYEMIA